MLTDDILQLHPFQVVPDPLIGVQLGGIGWQLLQMDSLPSRAGQEGFDLLAAVDGAAIPDHQPPHRDMGGQVPQEPRRIYPPEGLAWILVCSQPWAVMPLITDRWSRLRGARSTGVWPLAA
jgi:hypothetical protein